MNIKLIPVKLTLCFHIYHVKSASTFQYQYTSKETWCFLVMNIC